MPYRLRLLTRSVSEGLDHNLANCKLAVGWVEQKMVRLREPIRNNGNRLRRFDMLRNPPFSRRRPCCLSIY